MDQHIGFVPTPAGQLAYACVGSGPPVVLAPWWVSHLADDWEGPSFRRFIEAIAVRRRVIRFDRLGTGCSDRDRAGDSFTLDEEVASLEAVVDVVAPGAFDLLAISCGGCTAARYAARHPERVRRLVLYGTYADGRALGPADVRASMVDVVRAHWGLGARLLADVFMPGADAERRTAFARFQRNAAGRDVAASLLELIYASDVRSDLTRIAAPTLVLHRRRDRAIRYALGREVAALVPDARFAELDGQAHLPWHGDGLAVVAAAAQLLGIPPPAAATAGSAPDALARLSAREREVLRLVARGLTDPQIAAQLVISPHTVHRHVANIRTKLELPSRSAAAAHAGRAGFD
jgi:pimeloyl-ACP methyl ester carboxylesterase/DNA-binding CsgD family transcriptional regulator